MGDSQTFTGLRPGVEGLLCIAGIALLLYAVVLGADSKRNWNSFVADCKNRGGTIVDVWGDVSGVCAKIETITTFKEFVRTPR